jgi:hypothetical protein
MRNSLKIAAVLIAATAASASAQTGGRNSNGVPPGQRPRDGMCRVWVNGIAPGRQAAATDCATAEAQARLTPNSRVIYGGKPGSKGRNDDGLLTRRRQLADGSWVVERFRRDAAGNVTVVSTKPWKNGDKEQRKALKRQDKSEDRADKEQRKALKRQDKTEDRADKRRDDDEGRAENRRDNGAVTLGQRADDGGRGNSGGKDKGNGKGKH